MKKWILALLLAASPAFAQEKFNLFTRGAAPGCTTGDLLYVTSTPTIGCGSVLTAVGNKYVKLQSPGPGSVQTGGFNVDDSAQVGTPFIVKPASTGLSGTQTLAQFYANAPTTNSYHEIPFGTAAGVGFTQYFYNPSGGLYPALGWYLTGSNREYGVQFQQKIGGAFGVCINMDQVSSTYCGEGLNIGVVAGHAGFYVDNSGQIQRIAGKTFGVWPGMSANSILTTNGSGNFVFVPTSTYGPGTVTSIATTLPITGGTITSTGTIGISVTTTNDGGAVAKQASTPGTAQTGHINVSGTVKATTFEGALSGNATSATSATTATTATAANALATTGASVDVSGSAPPSGSSQACVTTDATHCTWQTVTVAGGSGNVTVAAKGDLQTYTTTSANLAVGTNGQVVMADSSTSSGLKYDWPLIGTLRTLKETVFAGLTPAGYSNGTTTTVDGSGYTATVPSSAAIDIVASGLRLRRGTSSGANGTFFKIAAGNTGDFLTLVGEERFKRGQPLAFWVRMASYDFTNTASGNSWAGMAVSASYPKWGFELRSRTRSINGSPNTTTGGIAFDHWMFGTDVNPSSYPGVSTADVLCLLLRDFNTAEIYYGTYSGAWPTLASMTLMGRVAGASGWIGAATSQPSATGMDIYFEFGGAANTSGGTAEVIFDRWRITTWE